MSSGNALLVFVDALSEIEGWFLLSGGGVAARGAGLEGLPPLVDPATGDPVRVAAIVPGETVALHWLEIPGDLAPAQALGAARLVASEVSAQPLVDMHVSVGPAAEGSDQRIVALVPALAMAGWIGRFEAQGIDPDIVLPEPLLIPPPEEGFVRHDRGEVPLFRGRSDAFAMEPELAELVVRDAPVALLDAAGFEAGLAAAIADPPVNLRQGPFAKRRRWKIDWPLLRRLALLGLAILLVTLAIQIAAILRYTYAADALEAETQAIASQALGGRGSGAADLEERLTELRGSGAGYSVLAAALFAAVRDTPNVEVSAITFERDGSLRATVSGDAPATVATLRQRIEASGFTVDAAAAAGLSGGTATELTVRAR